MLIRLAVQSYPKRGNLRNQFLKILQSPWPSNLLLHRQITLQVRHLLSLGNNNHLIHHLLGLVHHLDHHLFTLWSIIQDLTLLSYQRVLPLAHQKQLEQAGVLPRAHQHHIVLARTSNRTNLICPFSGDTVITGETTLWRRFHTPSTTIWSRSESTGTRRVLRFCWTAPFGPQRLCLPSSFERFLRTIQYSLWLWVFLAGQV